MEIPTAQVLLQLRTLSDAMRMRLVALCRQGECSVSELTGVTGQSQPRISQHLKQLCEAGFVERFRDGKRVYYRVPARSSTTARRLLELIPTDDALFDDDLLRLRRLRGEQVGSARTPTRDGAADRAIHRAIVELTVTAPLGDLLDVGCGRGGMLKLLASRAHRAIGVDIDAGVRRLARAELMLAGLPNCSLRQGDMYRLPFEAAQFDTVILDDVLGSARQPVAALTEAARLLRPGGRLFVLMSISGDATESLQRALAGWSAAAGLRIAPARLVPKDRPRWLLAVATPAQTRDAAA